MSDDPLILEFIAPDVLLSMNDSGHWSKTSPVIAEWRRAAYFYACAALPTGPSGRLRHGRQRVAVVLPVPDRRRRDPMNYVATVKPIVDGLTDAGLWPDDTPDHVTVHEPVLLVGSRTVLVTITPDPIPLED